MCNSMQLSMIKKLHDATWDFSPTFVNIQMKFIPTVHPSNL